MLGCLMGEGLVSSCCGMDSKPQCVLKLPAVQEHRVDTAMGGGGKQGWLLWVNKQHFVWGSDCQQRAVPLASYRVSRQRLCHIRIDGKSSGLPGFRL